MNKFVVFALPLSILLLSGCSGLAPQYDFKPVTPKVMTLNDPVDPSPRSAGAIYQTGRDMRLFDCLLYTSRCV